MDIKDNSIVYSKIFNKIPKKYLKYSEEKKSLENQSLKIAMNLRQRNQILILFGKNSWNMQNPY